MEKFHFFGTNAFEFHVDSDIKRLMKYMDKRGYEYGVWYVPGDVNAEYDIKGFEPQVKGAVWLGKYQVK